MSNPPAEPESPRHQGEAPTANRDVEGAPLVTVHDDELESDHPLPLNFIRAEVEAEIARLERAAQMLRSASAIEEGGKRPASATYPPVGARPFLSCPAPSDTVRQPRSPGPPIPKAVIEPRFEPPDPLLEPLRADPESAPALLMSHGSDSEGGGWGAWLLAVALVFALAAGTWWWLNLREAEIPSPVGARPGISEDAAPARPVAPPGMTPVERPPADVAPALQIEQLGNAVGETGHRAIVGPAAPQPQPQPASPLKAEPVPVPAPPSPEAGEARVVEQSSTAEPAQGVNAATGPAAPAPPAPEATKPTGGTVVPDAEAGPPEGAAIEKDASQPATAADTEAVKKRTENADKLQSEAPAPTGDQGKSGIEAGPQSSENRATGSGRTE